MAKRAALICLAFAILSVAQTPDPGALLSFASGRIETGPEGWTVMGTVGLDEKIMHGSRHSVRIEGAAGATGTASGLLRLFPLNFVAKRLEFRAFLRSADVEGRAVIALAQFGDSGVLGVDTTENRSVTGTADWQEQSVAIEINPATRQFQIGIVLNGSGTVWADGLQILADGKPFWELPKLDPPKTPIDTDHEFDSGSKIRLKELTAPQIDNLVALGKVWGFLKYHHPEVTSGKRHWDYDLFRVMPAVLAAPDRAAANAAMAKWIAALPTPAKCNPCAKLDRSNLHFPPDLKWLDDEALGAPLRDALRAAYDNRPANGSQFYVALFPNVQNPNFLHEPAYPEHVADTGYQILAAFRYWNIIEYWFPYRDILGENWDDVLRQALPKIALAVRPDNYHRAMMWLIAHAHDTHSNLWSSMMSQPPVGECRIPINVRFIGNSPVVAGYLGERTPGIDLGDIITALDGKPVSELLDTWRPYYAASNEPTRLRDIGRNLTRGECGDTALGIRRGNEELRIAAARTHPPADSLRDAARHELPGDAFRRLSDDVAYLKLSAVKVADCARFIDRAAGAKGLIIDIRNYPAEFVVFALGNLLAEKPVQFARFTAADLANPGAFQWRGDPLSLNPGKPHFAGKVIVLIDETSQSQAEYTTMAFRAAGAKVIGSTTAGADGNVSTIPLPGGLRSMISGIGVFYPDKTPTQRIGIVPDIELKPTIEGIRAGRDELIDEAIRQILGQ